MDTVWRRVCSAASLQESLEMEHKHSFSSAFEILPFRCLISCFNTNFVTGVTSAFWGFIKSFLLHELAFIAVSFLTTFVRSESTTLFFWLTPGPSYFYDVRNNR